MSRVDICLLGPSDATVLDRLAPEVFDHDVQPDWCQDTEWRGALPPPGVALVGPLPKNLSVAGAGCGSPT